MTPATPPAPARRQFRRKAIQRGIDGGRLLTDTGLVRPGIRIEHSRTIEQRVSLLRCPGPSGDALADFAESSADAGRRGCSECSTKEREVLGWRRHGRRRRLGWRLPLSPLSSGLRLPLLSRGRWFLARDYRFPLERNPVEAQVRVCVLEGLPDLTVEWPAAHPEIAGRTENVQDAGARMTRPRPASMHDVGVLEPALVARLTNERQEP